MCVRVPLTGLSQTEHLEPQFVWTAPLKIADRITGVHRAHLIKVFFLDGLLHHGIKFDWFLE